MDVVRLDPQTWLPDEPVENFSSMIWTERYLDAGEFVLTTPAIDYTRKLIPEESIITLRDSAQIMIVETSTIKRDDKGTPTLEVTGRSLETFIENRVQYTLDRFTDEEQSVDEGLYTDPEFAAALIWNSLCNRLSPAVPGYPYDWFSGLTGDPRDLLPKTAVSFSFHGTNGSDITLKPAHAIKMGEIYTPVKNILTAHNLAMRCIRPFVMTGSIPKKIDFNYSGNVVYSTASAATFDQMRFEIYDGVDHSKYQTTNPVVAFDYNVGDVKDASYLFSTRGYRNYVSYFAGEAGSPVSLTYAQYQNYPADDAKAGLNRRVSLYVGPKQGDEETDAAYIAGQIQAAELIRKSQKKTVIFDGTIIPNRNVTYGLDYGLGDLITLRGEFGLDQTMMVSEYIRTYDMDGDTGYPTLIDPIEKGPNE